MAVNPMFKHLMRSIFFIGTLASLFALPSVLPYSHSLAILPDNNLLPGHTFYGSTCDYQEASMGGVYCFGNSPSFGAIGLTLHGDTIANSSWGIPSSITMGDMIAAYGVPLGYHL